MQVFKEMIGCSVNKIYIDDSELYLKFETKDKNFIYMAEKECCNDVWFAHITGLPFLLNSTIKKVVSYKLKDVLTLDADEDSLEGCQEFEEILQWTLITTKGRFSIEVRNSNNGYYGGKIIYLDNLNDIFFLGELFQKGPKLKFKEITKDF